MRDDRRLIEDYLPIEAISAEASREKSVRKGHISTLHLWWARRPLVACRAAVYGALVPASRFAPQNGPEEKRASLGRANAAKFMERLCKYPGNPQVIAEAQRHILEAHAERLSRETGKHVTAEDIEAGRAQRPKVLDMFAGGGAIPLEALRLGCEAYALDLNPVAYIIELCTLVYAQKYGKPDPNTKGSAKDGTWAGLAEEVRYWGTWVLKKAQAEIGDLYPLIPDPAFKGDRDAPDLTLFQRVDDEVPLGYLVPVAYLWTRTVTCKNPACKAEIPLVRQTWLCKKKERYVALRMIVPKGGKSVRFQVAEAPSEKYLGFDPTAFSRGGNATCPFCRSVADSDYVKVEACSGRLQHQLLAVVCNLSSGKGKLYLPAHLEWGELGNNPTLIDRAERIASRLGITVPDEPLEANPRSFDVQHFGFKQWRDVFTGRQLIAMTTFAGMIKQAHVAMLENCYEEDYAKAVSICLSSTLGRLADYCTSFCTWQPEFIKNTFNSPGMPMIMDFAEANPLVNSSGGWLSALDYVTSVLEVLSWNGPAAHVERGSALSLPYANESFDAVITDPPYYDSRSYSNLADHFYVWHKQAIGALSPEHFASQLTPKKAEAIAAPYRHGGERKKADASYEQMMQHAFQEACRVLKPGRPMICVYAHKTTAGWATLVNALRYAGFSVHEAWPVEMERKVRQNAQETAALASSILLVARKRESMQVGSYENEIRPKLAEIVHERVDTLWKMGISGADLVIAAVGAGLQTFTHFARVEYANGEEVPAERFLTEVETVVLENVLARLSKEAGTVGQTSLAGVDPATRFYTLWRYTYRTAELEAGEAIIFANGTHVELDGPGGLSTGARALIEKKKGKYRLQSYAERGSDDNLGRPADDGQPVPVIDALHRTLWLMENQPAALAEFLREAKPNLEQMRLVAQALAGPALKGGELADVSPTGELAALARLTANWRSVIEDADMTSRAREERLTGQTALFREGERR